jgi:YD repeat-containing protein
VCGLVALGCNNVAALDVPVDPWADAGMQAALLGLKPGSVRSVRWSEQLFAPREGSAAPVSARTTQLEFDPRGRLDALTLVEERQNERATNRVFRYHHDADGRLARIEQDGLPGALLERHYDAAGRLSQEDEKVGVLLRQTRWRYDAAGRELGRRIAEGSSTRTTETRSYWPDGGLKRIEQRGGAMSSRTVEFDTSGRPTQIVENDLLSRQTTRIRYPQPLVAEHSVSRIGASREGVRSTTREVVFRVRTTDEFKRPGEPEKPVSRRVAEAGKVIETQADFDNLGRPRAERFIGPTGELVCVSEWQWHASGLPAWTHTRQEIAGTHCGLDNGSVDFDITVDEHGHWVRQVIEITQPNGRWRIGVQTREIEFR